MAPMRQQPTIDDSWTEAEAVRLVRGFAAAGRRVRTTAQDSGLAAPAGQTARHAVLTRTVEDEVIPRLLMARRPQKLARAAAAADADARTAEQVDGLVDVVLHGTQSDATAYVEAIRDTACRSSRCSSAC